MSKLRFGIIGLGKISSSHIKAINEINGEVIATCDIDESKKIDYPFYKDYREMLSSEKLDIVSICTPNNLHAIQMWDILNSGSHCIIEKPIAINTGEVRNIWMDELLSKTNLKVFPVLQNRFNPIIKYIKNIIVTGALGKIHFIGMTQHWYRPSSYFNDWHGSKDESGGSFLTLGIHFVDMILHLIPKAPYNIKTTIGYKRGLEIEDSLVSTFELGNTIGSIDFSTLSYKNNFGSRLRIIAENGNIEIGGSTAQDVTYWDCYDIPRPPDCTCDENVYNGYSGSLALHPNLYRNVRDVLLKGEKQYVTLDDAYKTLSFMEDIIHAGRQ